MKNDHVTMKPRSIRQYIDFIEAYKTARRIHKMQPKEALERARALTAPIFYS